MNVDNVLMPGDNCWRKTTASYVLPLIDCENYFLALYESIIKARKIIFIVGWDIDSRVHLLRGEAAEKAEAPVVIRDLIAWKAKQTPEIKIYLLRWDSSLAFFNQRELWAKEVWDINTPDNVFICLDDTIPMGGSQHQKLVIIDDEIVYSGGMDIANQRWDTREHKINQPFRDDEDGPYGPHHDVQVLAAGKLAQDMAELVRWRWQRVCEITPPPIEAPEVTGSDQALPYSWPQSFEPKARNIECAIARTIPFMDDAEPKQEVRRMLLDLIAQAEDFIYIENQFASRQEIAEALNKQLKANKKLKLLLVSSYQPKGTMECEAYWAGRINFKTILESGIKKHRVALVYSSIVDENQQRHHKRIHSKLMSIDNKYLVIGSSNLTNRSMTLDTECDLVFQASTKEHETFIANIRNDLIAEHAGKSLDSIERSLRKRVPLKKILYNTDTRSYHLSEVNDSQFTDKFWFPVAQPISDPEIPLVPPMPWLNGQRLHVPNPRKKTIIASCVLAVAAVLLSLVAVFGNEMSWFSPTSINDFLQSVRGTASAPPAVIALYAVGGIFFVPVTMLSLAVAAVFGPIWGPIYGMCGALLSAAIMFGVGRLLETFNLRRLGGSRVQTIDEKFRHSGVAGVAAIRLIPIAPYSLVNIVAGISSVGLYTFLLGTFIGMLPPMIAKGLVGDSLTQIILNPSMDSIGYLAIGILVWVLVVVVSQRLVRLYQKQRMA